MSTRSGLGPLAGVRIVDFTWVGAGSYATRILADLGADVVKVETRTRVDQIRLTPPFRDGKPGPNRSGYFADRNAGKRSITVNMKRPGGPEIIDRLLRGADVLASNFTPGTMERLGLGYAEVSARHPGLVYVEMSMQGHNGPHAHHVGYGLTIGALAGLQYLVGERGRPPIGTGTNYADHIPSPGHAAFAILAALRYRRRTGKGQRIEISQTEATVSVLGAEFMAASLGDPQPPQANICPIGIMHDTFRTAGDDRWVAVAITSADEWAQFAAVLGLDLPLDPAWIARSESQRRATVRAWIERHTCQRDPFELVEALQESGVKAAVVATAADLIERDPQLAHRQHWLRFPHPEAESFLYNAMPFRMSESPTTPRFGAPCLGEHTDEVLESAGYTHDVIARLRADSALD